MNRKRRQNAVVMLIFGLIMIGGGWFVETLAFLDTGPHGSSIEAHEILENAVRSGQFDSAAEGVDVDQNILYRSIEMYRVYMDDVRGVRSKTMWLFVLGGGCVLLGSVMVMRLRIDTGE